MCVLTRFALSLFSVLVFTTTILSSHLCSSLQSSTENQPFPHHQLHPDVHENIKIYIYFLSISNDLSPDNGLELLCTGDNAEHLVYQGHPFEKAFVHKLYSCLMIEGSNIPLRQKQVDVIDPKVDGENHHVYWSVRHDGFYHSWNGKTWQKKATW